MFSFIKQLFGKNSKASAKIWRPVAKDKLIEAQLIAVDFETTGLDPDQDEIISMGFCPIKNSAIPLADCIHLVVNTERNLTSENVAIHGLTDDVLSAGISQKQALMKFIELTENKIIVAHHHNIERAFIQKLANKILGTPIPLSFSDTHYFAKLRMERKQQPISQESLRLFNLREQQGLPHYKAHNALEDAISTAELYLAQKASLNTDEDKISLKDMGLFNYKN
ncbi:MAG: hypothetical protein DRQ47_00715 [Gammaproteobacteria bacterium]|nr:MAG: hypothetical protein DRQ47_00715 [Gammaproteobacteria bacterium]